MIPQRAPLHPVPAAPSPPSRASLALCPGTSNGSRSFYIEARHTSVWLMPADLATDSGRRAITAISGQSIPRVNLLKGRKSNNPRNNPQER
jgi:hypothetical protein